MKTVYVVENDTCELVNELTAAEALKAYSPDLLTFTTTDMTSGETIVGEVVDQSSTDTSIEIRIDVISGTVMGDAA